MIINESNNGETVQTSRGSRIEIKLPSNPTTGYRWGLPVVYSRGAAPDTVLVLLNKYTPTPVKAGSGGFHRFIIEFTASGVFDLRFGYKRGWEPKPGKIFHVIFEVK